MDAGAGGENSPTVRLDHRAGDAQADPQPALRPRHVIFNLIEALENPLKLIAAQTDAAVGHLNPDLAPAVQLRLDR